MSLHAIHWLALGRIALALIAAIPPAVSYVAPAPPAAESGAGPLVGQARCVFVRPTPLVLPGASTVTIDRYGGPSHLSRHPLLGSAIVSDEGQIAVLVSSINGL